LDEEAIMYLLLTFMVALAVVLILPSFGKGIVSILALILALVTVAIIVMLNWADFIIFPLVTSLLGMTFQPARNYKITKNQDAIVKNVNGLYYATGYVTANLLPYVFKLESRQEEENQKMLQAPDTWERAIMNIGFPFKFHVLSSGLDVQDVRDELEGKRSYQEFQLSRLQQGSNASETAVTEIRRKISVLQTKIDRISQGEKPIATIMYFETTAVDVSEKAAVDRLSAQIKSLQVSFSSLDVQLAKVVGRELYTLFKFNFSLPTTYTEISGYFDRQS
jgi:hypothetical protein